MHQLEHGALAIGVEEVVAQDAKVGVILGHHVDEVEKEVVGWNALTVELWADLARSVIFPDEEGQQFE